ncbi:MAG: DNA-directed RNA polymerase [Lysobacteraceae bacterium]
MTDLYDTQRSYEDLASRLGAARYRAEKPMPWAGERRPYEKEESELPPGQLLLKKQIEPVAQAIQAKIDDFIAGKAGRYAATVWVFLAELDPKVLAYLTCRRVINAMGKEETLTAVARAVGALIEEHYASEEFAKADPGLAKWVERRVKQASGVHRRLLQQAALRINEVRGLEWTVATQLQVGTALVELYADVTGMAEMASTKTKGGRNAYAVVPTEKCAAWLEEAHGRCELLAPMHLPMVVPPRDWKSAVNGGYLTRVGSVRLVKTRRKETIDDYLSSDLSRVMDAVNRVQQTPWAINRSILAVLEEALERSWGCPGVPGTMDVPIPLRPAGIPADVRLGDLPKDQQKTLKEWKAKAAEAHAENGRRRAQRIELAQKLWVSREFAQYDAIYFPHNLDFRGRVYPVPALLNPQGDDLTKGLLQFGRGKPLGETGAFWLAVHIANCAGYDKASFEDRVEWVRANEDGIIASALSPWDNYIGADGAEKPPMWQDSDSPWCFLAAAQAWAGYKLNGPDYVCHIPVSMDGSCSGLQHYSAMLRDPVGGAAVNLVPAEKKADIYNEVAVRVNAVIAAMDPEAEPMAAVWAGKVTRSVVKQPTMTYAYSATVNGMRNQIMDAIRKQGLEIEEPFAAAGWLAKLVLDAIRETVFAAASAMDFLMETAEASVAAELPLVWTTPDGLPVVQDEREEVAKTQTVYWHGQRLRLAVFEETKKLSKRRNKSALPPNFVHSLDATHLRLAVVLGHANGIVDWAVVHDSFGTHAADVDLLHAVLRQSFIDLYQENPLSSIRNATAQRIELTGGSPDLPPVPPTGTLELEAVMDSDFCFA